MSVTFSEYDILYDIKKDDYNKVRKRKRNEYINRQLSRIERYMKKHHLLLKNEFLEFSCLPTKHIRIGYIENICRNKNWIFKKCHLKIIHY